LLALDGATCGPAKRAIWGDRAAGLRGYFDGLGELGIGLGLSVRSGGHLVSFRL
jgi:hypothetical protein